MTLVESLPVIPSLCHGMGQTEPVSGGPFWQINTEALNGMGGASLTRAGDYRACNCVGGSNCCIEVGKRAEEARIRADERRKVLAERNGMPQMAGAPWECPRCRVVHAWWVSRCDCPTPTTSSTTTNIPPENF